MNSKLSFLFVGAALLVACAKPAQETAENAQEHPEKQILLADFAPVNVKYVLI